MTTHKVTALASLAFLFFSASAQAELQTWRLTSTTYQVQNGFTPPAFALIGNDFYIDYLVETQTPSLPGWDGMFSGAVKSFSVNGITSQSDGYISAHGGLNAINIWPSSSRSDGIDFLSFNNFSGTYTPNVTSALEEFADFAPTSSTDLRVDFGDKSIWAKPSSFVMTSSVPEPSSLLLAALGVVGMIGLKNRRQQA
jgi:hypothetical protein